MAIFVNHIHIVLVKLLSYHHVLNKVRSFQHRHVDLFASRMKLGLLESLHPDKVYREGKCYITGGEKVCAIYNLVFLKFPYVLQVNGQVIRLSHVGSNTGNVYFLKLFILPFSIFKLVN